MAAPRYALEQLTTDFGFYLRDVQTLAQVDSPWQRIEVFENPLFGRVMRIDGCFMTSERDEFFYHEPMVHLPAVSHGNVRSALIVGGGDGGAAEELLKYPSVQRVVLAELDGAVIETARRFLPEIHRGAFDDPRLEIRLGDARALIEAGESRFDQIILDLTDPFGPATELYTVEFYAACRRILHPGGVLSLHLGSPIHRADTMARIHASLAANFNVVRPYLQYVPLYGTLWCMASASDTLDPLALSAAEIDARLHAFALSDLKLYNGATHLALLAQPNFVREIFRAEAAPIHRGEELQDVCNPAQQPALHLHHG